MARHKRSYVCQGCGYTAPKWMGRCPDCKEWNGFIEQVQVPGGAAPAPAGATQRQPVALADIQPNTGGELRVRTGLNELDTVLGGGLVAGSLVLVGGDPGVGKSTLLLMALDHFSRRGTPVLYVTGEESTQQVRLRAERLSIEGKDLLLLAHTDFSHIESVIQQAAPRVVVIDSVQTVYLPHLESIPGSVTQVREVAHRAMMLAKRTGVAIFLVGHITKSGQLAGPKVLEHFVDTVIYFEGDGRSPLRILRSVKNRFGPAGELGLFEMADCGLVEVPDASARLLAERTPDAPGTVVVASIEGSRPLLTEIQALVGNPSPSTPARTCVGTDRTRVSMLAAVLEKFSVPLHDRDLFVNAAGGVRADEPAADLAILAAIASSLSNNPVASDTVFFGEVGLVGEIRSVSHPAQRLREAARHGFRRAIIPRNTNHDAPPGLELVGVQSVREVLDLVL